MSIPILFVGDSPNLKTGLGRIGRDLATLTAQLPEFRVGYFGRGGQYTRSLPFAQYSFQPTYEAQWGEDKLANALWDFARGDERVIVFTIWDPSRVTWVRDVIGAGVQLWGYFAVDGKGIGVEGALTGILKRTLLQYDRRLAYTAFGARVLLAATGLGAASTGADFLPHGINLSKFQPRDQSQARKVLGLIPHDPVIGCVMANQPRKDWGALLQSMQLLKLAQPGFNPKLICRTDDLSLHWNIPALIADLGLDDGTVTMFTAETSDEDLSWWYSACDLTVLPSLGEGFGYPIVESLACGVPVIHIDYAGGAEIVRRWDSSYLLPVESFRIDTRWNIQRPVIDPMHLARRVFDYLTMRAHTLAKCRASVEDLSWEFRWPQWREWLLSGIEGVER